ncbi:hypothetical protein [Moraxella sp. ZY200743]|uniref:hypothetical protein n=1 Tax=Moraxella sp. ZY200743 TaxID=2911970 RepID=UPI003D7EDCF8
MPNPSNHLTQITPHFSYRELTRSETARRQGSPIPQAKAILPISLIPLISLKRCVLISMTNTKSPYSSS